VNLTQLRLSAREIFDEALRVVQAGEAVRQAIRLDGSRLTVCETSIEIANRNVYSIALGKAAQSMACAVEGKLATRFTEGVIAGPPLRPGRDLALSTRWRRYESGHPAPNDSSIEAAREALALLDLANSERAIVIFLISGGGSAMLELPISEEISLEDLREANRVLTSCGASIVEINAVRRAFSAIKGGRLAAHAPDCDQITLIVSDVPFGEELTVASGPTLMPSADAPLSREVIAHYNLEEHLPITILRAIRSESEAAETSSIALREHFVLLNNKDALEAAASAAQRRGFFTEIADDISDQPIEHGCVMLLQRLEKLARDKGAPVCLISGGEFSCPVRGEGIGGRNLETALRLASSTDSTLSLKRIFAALSAGTDGIDGNSPAAGALVDSTTINRAKGIGLDAADFIERSDSYSFFVALGDVVATGATGTNVRDIRILLSSE
jgi:glycerate 2-kinase